MESRFSFVIVVKSRFDVSSENVNEKKKVTERTARWFNKRSCCRIKQTGNGQIKQAAMVVHFPW